MGLLPCVLRSVTSFLQLEEASSYKSETDTTTDGRMDVSASSSVSTSSSSSSSSVSGVPVSDVVKGSQADITDYIECLLWTESVLGLTMALISVTPALPALTDNGVIYAIASLLSNKPQGNSVFAIRFSGDGVCPRDIERVGIIRVHIDCLVVQILDTSITNHSGAFIAFKEQGGAEAALVRLLDELQMLSIRQLTPVISSNEVGRIENSAMDIVETIDEALPCALNQENVLSCGVSGTVQKVEEEVVSPTSAVLTITSSEAVAAVTEGQKYKIIHLPPASKVLLHQLISLVISWVQDTQQDSGDHLHGQLLKGPIFARIFGVLFSNVTILSNALISPTVALIADIVNNDPAPPGLLSHMLTSGIIELAMRSCLNPELEYSCDLLMSISSLISACCLTQEGLDLVKEINPFNHLFSLLLDEKYYYPYSKMFMSDLPNNFGGR